MDAKKRESEQDLAVATPHYHGHRERLRAVHDHIIVGKEGHASLKGLKLI
jgi:DNA repair protein RadC